jgi:hypothetical protein
MILPCPWDSPWEVVQDPGIVGGAVEEDATLGIPPATATSIKNPHSGTYVYARSVFWSWNRECGKAPTILAGFDA